MIEVSNQKVMVVGMAKSGFSAARLLLKLGARVLLYDQKKPTLLMAFRLFLMPARKIGWVKTRPASPRKQTCWF